jgi:hypothetical protein
MQAICVVHRVVVLEERAEMMIGKARGRPRLDVGRATDLDGERRLQKRFTRGGLETGYIIDER